MRGVLAPLLLAAAQVTVQAPGMKVPERKADRATSELRRHRAGGARPRQRRRRAATSRASTAPYFALEQGTERVMVIPMPGSSALLESLLGRGRRGRGFRAPAVRAPGRSAWTRMPQSYCDDPDLPPTPDRAGRPDWPRCRSRYGARSTRDAERNCTAGDRGSLADSARRRRIRRAGHGTRSVLRRVPVREPGHAGARARRMADRPTATRPSGYVGKEPRGKGWRLDPGYAADASRWVEVTGKVVACGAARCLRASKVELAPAPRPPDEP